MKKVLFIFLLFIPSLFLRGQIKVNIIESNNQFAFDVYNQLKKTNNNLILSPSSITSAMAMTYVGAKNRTSDEIGSSFYFEKDKEEFCKDYFNLYSNKKKTAEIIKLFNANSLWLQEGLDLEEDFTNKNKNYFNSSLHVTDFLNFPERSRININSWVEKNTSNRIKNLIKPSAIDNSTRLVLVNALYFKGAWDEPFKKENNTEENFQVKKKEYITATFMNKTVNVWYYSDKCLQIIDLPYEDTKFSLMIILPKSFRKFKKIEKQFNYAYYSKYINAKEMKRVNVSIPKFNIESEFDLNKTLNDLGVKEAFTSAADFSGITSKEKLYISQVVHKANITIDENGTEAAAATAVLMRKTAFMNYTDDFKANKPFLFILRNNENDLIYFMGKITNPKN